MIGRSHVIAATAGMVAAASAVPISPSSLRFSSARAARKPKSTISISTASGGWISVIAPEAAATEASSGHDGLRT